MESETSLDDSLGRISFFLSAFTKASDSGDIHYQLGRRLLSRRERKLLEGTNRALRWLSTASSEEDILDRFTATWIALEAILNSVTYPGVFAGERAVLKEEIQRTIRNIHIPRSTQKTLAITTNMLEGRVLHNNWSLARKLTIFAESVGIHLKSDDQSLVNELSRNRNNILHGGNTYTDLSLERVNQLRYLVERLIVGVSIGGYEDLEDRAYEFHIGEIGPEGGGAPISIDGKEDVPYELRVITDSRGQQVAEWIAEGKIYSEKNIRFT